MRIRELLGNAAYMANCSSFNNLIGYAGSSLTGFAAATAIGSVTTIIATSFVGGMALYVPYYLLKQTLQYFEMTSELLHSTLDLAFHAGAAATGALILGANIPAAALCALVGIVAVAIVAAIEAMFPEADSRAAGPNKQETRQRRVPREERTEGHGLFKSFEMNPRFVVVEKINGCPSITAFT